LTRSVNVPLSGTVQTLPAQEPPALTVIDIVASVVRADVRVKWTATQARAARTIVPPRSQAMRRMILTSRAWWSGLSRAPRLQPHQ